jgi:hypothetical protein
MLMALNRFALQLKVHLDEMERTTEFRVGDDSRAASEMISKTNLRFASHLKAILPFD